MCERDTDRKREREKERDIKCQQKETPEREHSSFHQSIFANRLSLSINYH